MLKRWSDDVYTEPLMSHESAEYDDFQPYQSMRLMKLLFVAVTVAALSASVAVVMHIGDRSAASAPTVDAHPGDCLTWPPGAPERAMRVDCADEHLFEVADAATMNTSATDIEFQQTCARAVERHLGSRYDPAGRFVVGMVWTTQARDLQSDGRLMCGLQLPSDGIASVGFRGRVVDQDQSSVWPAGTCLGIRDGKATEVPVQCALPHALEITGAIDLSTVFDTAAPSTAAQDAVVRDACGAATSQYLSPVALEATGLTLRYQPIAEKGWDAGSRRIACRIGSEKPDGGWATLLGTAKTGVIVDGQPVATLPSPVAAPPSAAEPPPAETTAPVIEAQLSSPPIEVPVSVTPQTHVPAEAPGPVPHLVDAEAPGPPALDVASPPQG
ncbi:putative regulator of septum formation [Mycolicibacterium moriokaense]|uniref:Putative regulator of septum formation n=1 Tax=Mycolicibacterium moriokaense TaxID=39691 RepID=A0A318HID7_9MYCO|nr:putative regulator of septum formation [Mycolicibacterium moriokaense]